MLNLENIIERKILPLVKRPGSYIGSELNSVEVQENDFQVALAFPDLYEIGFAYTGFQILYNVLNKIEGITCQRVFAPAIDMENLLRKENIPLFTLEGKNPLSEMDIVGFTLQYELHASNILNMLELANIPLRAEARAEDDPIVIAGGPISFNPEAFAPFFDAILIGDGEKAFPEIIQTVKIGHKKGLSREEVLKNLNSHSGIYIPALHTPHFISDDLGDRPLRSDMSDSQFVKAVHIPALDVENYPEKPLVPLISTEHDRLAMEIMRGCTRGCRFCHAGMTSRPTRELPLDDVVRLMTTALENTGYDEVSLLSLSTADYSDIVNLIAEIKEKLEDSQISLSYPSLRLDAFTEDIVSILSGRKTGLTFAPEAGSERLRRVINKDLTDEDLFNALKIASDRGWRSVKLYFMIGLPSETDEDVWAIVDLAKKCRELMKSSLKKPLHVSIGVYSPKPHTPFQRFGMIEIEEAFRRIDIVRNGLRSKAFKVSFHDPKMTHVETLIARGDRRVADVIERVFKSGARFEGWSDEFDFDLWLSAMREEGLNWESYNDALDGIVTLPWDVIRTGINPEFMEKEWGRTQESILTPDCRWRCSKCGMECPPPPKPKPLNEKFREKVIEIEAEAPLPIRNRVKFSIEGPVKYISHLEKVKLFERALRRSGARMIFSGGFHPHPKIAFGPALPVGYETTGDYFDVHTESPIKKDEISKTLPKGVNILEIQKIPANTKALSAEINLFSYEIVFDAPENNFEKILTALENRDKIVIPDRSGNDWDINEHLHEFESNGNKINLSLRIISGKSPRPDKILKKFEILPGQYKIRRTGCYILADGNKIDPLNVNR